MSRPFILAILIVLLTISQLVAVAQAHGDSDGGLSPTTRSLIIGGTVVAMVFLIVCVCLTIHVAPCCRLSDTEHLRLQSRSLGAAHHHHYDDDDDDDDVGDRDSPQPYERERLTFIDKGRPPAQVQRHHDGGDQYLVREEV